VFNLFVQGERSLARTEGGLGIGLTVVRQLVALHGGTVVARSEGTNQGSEFIVLLPVLAQNHTAKESNAGVRANAHRTKRRVLVVDDNRDSAETLAAVLVTLGHDAHVAYDGTSAIAATADYHPDVVLLDIGLPGMSGFEVAKRLRESADPQRISLIAVTGYGQEEVQRRTRDAGFLHHLIKPVDPAALETILESIRAPAASQ
jgi:CheY-like chemotaxis protein